MRFNLLTASIATLLFLTLIVAQQLGRRFGLAHAARVRAATS